ncbi:hypothetical protein D5S17_00515 [Pseudonocardiaceae bacterium YIM PH 21723]|nr:hypothetical protein D5S17_00515 [Pseudonocardiaceae bacterium YIM PH 21723]
MIALSTIAAFEGFCEEFLANLLLLNGHGYVHVAKVVGRMNNPTPRQFCAALTAEIPSIKPATGKDYSLQVWKILGVNQQPSTETIGWSDVLTRADGWMEVRHCLSHGLVSGWRSEVWPAPLKGASAVAARDVLRAKAGGKHSMGLIGAISCSRLYYFPAQHLADLVAGAIGQSLSWSDGPTYPLKKTA